MDVSEEYYRLAAKVGFVIPRFRGGGGDFGEGVGG